VSPGSRRVVLIKELSNKGGKSAGVDGNIRKGIKDY